MTAEAAALRQELNVAVQSLMDTGDITPAGAEALLKILMKGYY